MRPPAQIRELFRGRPVGGNIAYLLFLAVCFQAAILVPYVVVVRGEPTNLFTAVLAGAALAACLLLTKGRRISPVAAGISILLAAFVLLSGWFSALPRESLLRGGAMILSGAGGFWCARLLLRDETGRLVFAWYCLGLAALVILVAFAGGLFSGELNRFLDDNPHQLVCKIFLLSFAPIFAAIGGGRRMAIAGVLLLAAMAVVLYLSTLRSALIIPAVVAAVFVATRAGKYRFLKAAGIVSSGVIALALLFLFFPDRRLQFKDYEPVSYRVESYPFSWHVAKQHPLLGNGLRAPRDKYLENYTLQSPLGTREAFADSVRRIRTSENVLLTFFADLGIPFTLVYTMSIAAAIVTALRWRTHSGRSSDGLLLDAMMFSFACAAIHCLNTDDFLIPQVNWFFHVVLGMICALVAEPVCAAAEQSAGNEQER